MYTAASQNTETANRGLRTLSVIDNSFYKLINGMEQRKHCFSSSLRATYLQSSTYSGFCEKHRIYTPSSPRKFTRKCFFSGIFIARSTRSYYSIHRLYNKNLDAIPSKCMPAPLNSSYICTHMTLTFDLCP